MGKEHLFIGVFIFSATDTCQELMFIKNVEIILYKTCRFYISGLYIVKICHLHHRMLANLSFEM